MSKFPSWFSKAYNRWKKSQPGEENFPAFCDLLGYPATKVMSWLQGESYPDGPEVLSLAGLFGENVYGILDLPKPDPDLLKIFCCLKQLKGQDRSKLAMAIFEAGKRLTKANLSTKSIEAKEIFESTFKKYGLQGSSSED